VQKDLDNLPESFEDSPQAKILHLCGVFNTEIDAYATAMPKHTSFFRDFEFLFTILKDKLRATRPNFEIVEPDESKGNETPAQVLSVDRVQSTKRGIGEKASQRTNFLQ